MKQGRDDEPISSSRPCVFASPRFLAGVAAQPDGTLEYRVYSADERRSDAWISLRRSVIFAAERRFATNS
jgi:hypothetical protein